jgi:peptidyl-prolyl cis-trans isomerase SurA
MMQQNADISIQNAISNHTGVKISPRPNFVRKSITIAVLSAALAPALLSGCHRSPSADVMATVNGKAILRSEVDKYYKNQVGNAPEPSQVQADSLRLNILHGLIEDEIIQQRATKQKLLATDDEVGAKLTEAKAPYTQEQFDAKLKEQNLTVDDFKRDIRRRLTSDKLLNKEINSKINISDTDISNYYNQHKAEFNLVQPGYHLAQILVTALPPNGNVGNLQNSKATNEADASKKIQDLRNRLESGEDFGTLAANFSEDPNTSPSGGDLGFVAEADLKAKPTVYQAISNLKDGQITSIIPVPDPNTKKVAGFFIFKLISREPAGQRDLSDPRVQQAIHQQLQDGRSQLLRSAYLEMLHDQARVQNFFAEQIYNNEAR